MTDIFEQEDDILEDANIKLVELGQEAAERVLEGKQPDKQDAQAASITLYQKAYEKKDELTTKQQEALLYVLFQLSNQ